MFTLVADDFGVQYTDDLHAQHLIKCLEENYELTKNWQGDKYCGLDLEWDYDGRKARISMKGYIEKVLQRFKHTTPKNPQDSPHKHTEPAYGQKVQYAKEERTEELLTPEDIKGIQKIIGALLYYTRGWTLPS